MKINSVEVSNCKSLKDFKVSGFNRMNSIYGYNNSGKSNFLKFLNLIFKRKSVESPTSFYDNLQGTRTRREVEGDTSFWDGYIYDEPYLFTNDDREKEIEFRVTLEVENHLIPNLPELSENGFIYVKREATTISLLGKIISVNNTDSKILLTNVEMAKKLAFKNETGAQGAGKAFEKTKIDGNTEILYSVLGLFDDLILLIESERFFIKEYNEFNEFDTNPEKLISTNIKKWLFNQYINSDKYEDHESLIKFFNEFELTKKVSDILKDNLQSFPFDKTDIGFTKFEEELEVMLTNNFGRYPLKNFGTGIQQIFYIISSIFNSDSEIIIIEELELNLSPEYQELIVNNLNRMLDQKGLSQVFFTSHSDYLFRNDFTSFQTEIDSNGSTSMKSAPYDGYKALRRSFLEISKEGEK